MKKYILIIPILIFLFSCSILKNDDEKKHFIFSKKKINLKSFFIKNEIVDQSINKQIYHGKLGYNEKISDSIVVLSYKDSSQLNLFNLKTGEKIFDIKLPKIQRNLSQFHFINKDSILLNYQDDLFGKYDSCLMLINSKGKIKKIYSLKGSGVYCSENPEMYNNDNQVYLINNPMGKLIYINEKIILNFERKGCLGDPAYQGIPFTGYVDMKKNKFYPIKIEYPDIIYDGEHLFPSQDKRFFISVAHDGDLLYAFKYTPTILKYNIYTKKHQLITIKSTVFDTVYSYKTEKDFPKGLDFDMPYPKYYLLKFDSINNMYIRNVLLPASYGKFNFVNIIADTSFDLFAEGFARQKLLLGSVNNITYYNTTNQNIIKRIKSLNNREVINKPLTNYVKTFGNISDKNYTAIFFWIDGSCESTQKGILTYYEYYYDFFKKYHTYLFLIAQNKKYVLDLLKSNNLQLDQNIQIDSMYKFGSFTNYEVLDMPRVIKVRKGKLRSDSIFEASPEGAKAFEKYVFLSTKEQEKLLDN